MYCAYNDLLWIGNALEARDPQTVFTRGIEAVVDLALEEPPAATPREVIYLRFPLRDDASNTLALVRIAVESTSKLIQGDRRTLLCCGAGVSRSPSIAAAALAGLLRFDLDATLRMVSEQAPSTDISPAFWRQVKEALTE